MAQTFEDSQLILAAEDCSDEDFEKYHTFLEYEERIIRSLMAHGPVLLRGGRGNGKSALLLEANRRLKQDGTGVLGIYLSLRHLPLLKSKGAEYHSHFCRILIESINNSLGQLNISPTLEVGTNQDTLREHLVDLSKRIDKRIVLFFDDAAHIGREADLSEFFDLFRTLSGSTISCKAAIYPGVTKFGTRFDVYNDATVLDIARDERAAYFPKFFLEVLRARYPSIISKLASSLSHQPDKFAGFLGRAILGNMRTFVFACNKLDESSQVGLQELTNGLIYLAADYYWPLLEELKPKLGIYEPMIEPSQQIADALFVSLGETGATSCIIHRDIQQRINKPLEILEYVGFISKREASRGMKSGGRGARYSVTLCNLLENIQGKRVTSAIYDEWGKDEKDPFEFHSGNSTLNVEVPMLDISKDLAILSFPISTLKKSRIYPYGLTESKYEELTHAGFTTINDLALATDIQLLAIDGIGSAHLKRIRNVVAQSIWM